MKLPKKPTGFSLIEVAVVIIIIGIFVAGVTAANRMVSKSVLAAAENLSRSSPIAAIKDNSLWLETSLASSFADSEAVDETPITAWVDQSNSSSKVAVVAVGSGPAYANTINRVHAVKFSGSSANYLQISDASFLNNTDYTIFVLEKRQGNQTGNYFIGSASTSANNSLALGYSSDSTVVHAQGSNSYDSVVSSYSSLSGEVRQFTFVHSAAGGNKTYINGVLAAEDATKTAHLNGLSALEIGKNYTGEIGEIAIFTRALKAEEIQSVEDYIGKKWSRKVNRDSVSGGSCVGYTVTDSGCDSSAATCAINIAGLVTRVGATSSATSASCNQPDYEGSVTYTCISGTPATTGSCTSVSGCNSVAVAGVASAITASHGSSSTATCNATGYDNSTISYSCSNGILTTASNCGCDTANYSMVSSVCQPKCSVSETGVASGTKVDYTTSAASLSCDTAGGYSGTISYTCASGTFNKISGTCKLYDCAGGNADDSLVSGSTIHVFASSGTFKCRMPKTVQVLVVAGGGAGGSGTSSAGGGGGGAGGLIYNASFSVSTSPISVSVGAGGAATSVVTGNASSNGGNGGDSIFSSLTAVGGGGGGGREQEGSAGGSGGGAGITAGARSGGAAEAGQGHAGGSNYNDGNYGSGGGGGAGSAGANGTASSGGNGGAGLAYSIGGTSTYYAGGGGGSFHGSGATYGTGGTGGGGAVGVAGTANTGGGGGGAVGPDQAGFSGGSGVVIVRYVNEI